jgi:hypothetical protein
LVGKPKGKRPLGRPRHGSEDALKMDFRETGWDGLGWVKLAQNGLVVGSCEHGEEPSGSGTIKSVT